MNGVTVIEQKIIEHSNKNQKQMSKSNLSIKENYFQNTSTQEERYDNFSMYYTKYGKEFINNVLDNLTYDLENLSMLF